MSFVVMAGVAKQASPLRFFVLKPRLAKQTLPLRFFVLQTAAIAALFAFAADVPANAAAPAAAQDISGVWWTTAYSPKIQLVGGGDLPYTAAGKAAYDKNIAALKSGQMTDAARRYCVPDGVPRVLATPYPFEIIHTPGQTTLIYEMNHAIRVVAMDKPLPKDEELIPYPYYNGHSVGHWEGDTLVIETKGFNGYTKLDTAGHPHSRQVVFTNTFLRKDSDTIEHTVTVHDPKAYTQDWMNVRTWRIRKYPDVIMEYSCEENNGGVYDGAITLWKPPTDVE